MKKLLLTLSALSMLVAFDVSSAEYEEKLGHTPEPGRVALVNLKTREAKFMKFLIEDE